MKVSGFGTITKKGLEIFNYCKLNAIAISFQKYIATERQVPLTQLSNDAVSPYREMTAYELAQSLSGTSDSYVEGNIAVGDNFTTSQDNTHLPLLMSLVSNDYNEDLNIYSIFLTAEDPTSASLTISDVTSFNAGDSVADLTTGATGVIVTVNATDRIIEVENVTPTLVNGGGFVSGNIVRDTTTSTDATITASGFVPYVIYQGCGAYDERLSVNVASASTFSASGAISNSTGASGTVVSIIDNEIILNRLNVRKFNSGDLVDSEFPYVTSETNITNTPVVDLSTSTSIPIPYISDGSDMLLRITLRYSSGFPSDLTFPNTSITEIEMHDVEDSTHLDFRLNSALSLAKVSKDLRELKARLDAVVHRNSLLDEVE